jgi:hypothetical protein
MNRLLFLPFVLAIAASAEPIRFTPIGGYVVASGAVRR